jgi:hypothetical protein
MKAKKAQPRLSIKPENIVEVMYIGSPTDPDNLDQRILTVVAALTSMIGSGYSILDNVRDMQFTFSTPAMAAKAAQYINRIDRRIKAKVIK